MHLKCWYCPAVSPDFKGLVEHFEREHRNNDEHIVLEFPADRDGMPIIEEVKDNYGMA